MTRAALRLTFTLAAVLAAAPAFAQTDTFQVSANVARNCTVVAGDINIGTYDPVVANDSAAATATGTITVRCTKGTAYTVALGTGAHPSGSRQMQHATDTSEYLAYDLYTAADHLTVWNTANTMPLGGGTAASRAAVDLIVYASVPGGQDALEGAYLDTVDATINF
jgi:spore coat protein U-like protein